jgi:hypothetical protein
VTTLPRWRATRGKQLPAPPERSALWRVGVLLCLALQLGAAVLVPLADSFQETGRDLRPHVEALGTDDCPIPHDHLACQLCRTIRTGTGPLPSACPALAGAASASPTVRATPPALLSTLRTGPFGARAPPVL